MSDATHHATVESEVRAIANRCDLGGLNEKFFLRATFVSNLADYVQQRERAAYERGARAIQPIGRQAKLFPGTGPP